MTAKNNDIKIHHDFRKIFYKKEGIELLGKRNKNLWILVGILFVTFTAIGFASGSLKYLKKKMDDPYINWVNVNIPYGMSSEGSMIKDRLNADSAAQQRFHFNNVSAYYRYPLAFKNFKANGTMEAIGRSIDINDPILNEIFKDKNKILGRPFKDESDIGMIVTQEFLKKYGYDEKTLFVYISVALGDNNNEYVPVPVIAVLKELPGMAMFVTTPYFRQLKKEPARGNPFRRDGTQELMLFIPGDSVVGQNLKSSVEQYFQNANEYTDLLPWVTLTENHQSYIDGFNVSISFMGEPNMKQLDEIYKTMIASEELSDFRESLERIYNFKTYQVYDYSNFDYLAINFNDLTQVRAFKKYFFEQYYLRIDIAQIEAKENYSYVSKLTLIISFILIIFSVVLISMFVSNLLSRHLNNIKSNIGTFKAFGLSNREIFRIYSLLSMSYILGAMFIAFIASLLFGIMGGIRFGLTLFKASLEATETYFNLWNIWIMTSSLLIILVSMLVIQFTTAHILKKTPGDLIYNRK